MNRNPLATVLAIIGGYSPKAEREILAALAGDPVAISNTWKEVERMRVREREENDK